MSEEESLQLNPLVWDLSRFRLPEEERKRGLNQIQAQARRDWVVGLRFKQLGEADDKFGTGFFLNIPGAKWYVIVTAGHNLLDKNGNPSTDLIIERDKHEEPIRPLDPPPFVCPLYHGGHDTEHDYGAILIPRPSHDSKDRTKNPDIGFGFALHLGHEDLRRQNLELTGYVSRKEGEGKNQKEQAEKNAGAKELAPLVTSSGDCLRACKGHLEYRLETAKGLSGSPVILPYNGHEAVVAIHNNGPAKPGRGSTGARLNTTVLKQIFWWADLIDHKVALKAAPGKPKNNEVADPLYLNFYPYEVCAWVRWGEEQLKTAFDVFPAYAPTSLVDARMLHVFQHLPPADWPGSSQRQQWVLWDVMGDEVTLTDTLQPFCFVELKPYKKSKMLQIVVRLNAGRNQDMSCLVMNGDDITEMDRERGTFDGPGITFNRYLNGQFIKYNVFEWYDLSTQNSDRSS